jgi:hypothetical protein
VGTNAISLIRSLPTHSHHRAPLLQFLSRGLDSFLTASLFGSSNSYIRQLRRKDLSNSDLLSEKYERGVKRQKTAPQVQTEACNFIASSCPTKSGERSVSFHQYVTDDALYQSYMVNHSSSTDSTSRPLSFSTFCRLKRWMRVRRAGKYLGQFDCALCLRLRQVEVQLQAAKSDEERMALGQELQRCKRHQEVDFTREVSISMPGLISNPVFSCY